LVLEGKGTGQVDISNAFTLPNADGSNTQVLGTNGSGAVSFQDAIMDADISAGEGFLRKTGAGAYEAIKSNLAASTDPGATDDSGSGYSVGSRWINTTLDKEFVCLDATTSAAVWTETTGAGGSGDSWGDPVDAVITPDGDGTRDLALTGTRFATAYVDDLDVTTNIVVGGTVDGRDIATDGTKLDGIEALADVTDTANVTAAGALMDSEVDADIKTLALPANTTITAAAATVTDDATVAAMVDTLGGAAATGTGGLVRATSPTLVTPALGTPSALVGTNITGTAAGLTVGATTGVEAGADVTDATNVAAAGAVMDSDISAAEGFLRKTGAGAYEAIKSNLAASTDPGTGDDSGSGYSVGSRWINTTGDKEFVCLDATVSAAVWTETTAGAGGGISNVVEDGTPQLGGQLDVNGQAIGDGTRELVTFTEDASAVNHVNIENEATGSGPIISAAGDDANVDLNINAKGTGDIALGNFTFDGDQTVGAGQDNYVLTYDNAGGLISLEAAAAGGGGGGFTWDNVTGTTDTLTTSDDGLGHYYSNASPVTVTVTVNSYAKDERTAIAQTGAGAVTIVPSDAAKCTFYEPHGGASDSVTLSHRYSAFQLICIDATTDANVFLVVGMTIPEADLTPDGLASQLDVYVPSGVVDAGDSHDWSGVPGLIAVDTLGLYTLQTDELTYSWFYVDRPIRITQAEIDVSTAESAMTLYLGIVRADTDYQPHATGLIGQTTFDLTTAGDVTQTGLTWDLGVGGHFVVWNADSSTAVVERIYAEFPHAPFKIDAANLLSEIFCLNKPAVTAAAFSDPLTDWTIIDGSQPPLHICRFVWEAQP
jgi:hypothetical protein